ncbi:hypothetical protein E4T47_01887 [Aureobasidium subglaciale]|nr:hypothetical protein E4T47_01887 [Aureobasidium subglaciale]
MTDSHNIIDPIGDVDNNTPSCALLTKLITIEEEFTHEHAYQAAYETDIFWPDLEFDHHDIYDVAQILRQDGIVLELRLLRLFFVAWDYLPPGQAKYIQEMVLDQLGPVKKPNVTVDSNELAIAARAKPDAVEKKSDCANDETGSNPKQTPRTKTVESGTASITQKNGSPDKQEITPTRHNRSQILSPGSPFKLLFKTQKKWARQRQLKALISQSKKPKSKQVRRESMEIKLSKDDHYEEGLEMEPVTVSAAEKKALTRQKLERKRKLEVLALKAKKRTS